jgi:hypothetical protein
MERESEAPGPEYLVECRRSPKILQGLETLDLAQLCYPMNIAEDHHLVHKHLFGSQDAVACVLVWLSVSLLPDEQMKSLIIALRNILTHPRQPLHSGRSKRLL